MVANMVANDDKYLQTIVECLRTSAAYKPKFGQRRGEGLTLPEFQGLYRGDPFYNWFLASIIQPYTPLIKLPAE